ncbi:glycoside hydrolase family 3 N-terminal domain-containing protein [Murimonas intestini]|uniref:beta-glucosidase n=1 Tax=Murimonas intestini TaxID=1337051 RepID=A0AB73SYN8_9FIRM|nr:glycoside hydrolase family 3 N-terminal domain-containing protein [Murimonas intestini]MCR1840338.1 glycoside hydrolase family 3 C-terminal domain-containing protein [Murimonas intestini]MCR1868197.1 glycoside hydrolase family 3 C-terminal domain-containing protein [Murimonas intestini]MCR1885547.1 glycoside hydrolase family 3 C-terminal domain-containing protein [Murimonas intestini]
MKKKMRKAVSVTTALTLSMSLTSVAYAAEGGTEAADYIPAPYTADEGLQGPTEYLEPVFYENEDGPTIGVTLVGVISEDGKYFKDSNNNGELDTFEDWRLDTETRVADLLTKLTKEQRIGLLANQLMCSPTVTSADEVYDENGKVDLNQLMVVTEDALNMVVAEEEEIEGDAATKINAGAAAVETAPRPNSTGEMLTFENRSGVLRATTDAETGALWNNATNMTAEYAAVAKNEPTIPFTIISNPQQVIKIPGSMGVAAAVMGAGAEEGDYSLVEHFADVDRQIWDAKGISRMYGPQIDLITDPRWNRNSGTYTEVPDVAAGIASALVKGYQTGTDGAQDGDVALIMKHFPGDGASYNGFESHNAIGQWRIYQTEGSLEKYQLVGFQAAIDAGVAGIMPGYSRPAADGTYGSVAQSYRDVELTPDQVANAYNTTLLQTLLRDTMGFSGFVNTDSGVLSMGMQYGAEELTAPERVAAMINAGSDIIGDGFTGVEWQDYYDAYDQGLIEEAALDRANASTLATVMNMGQFENPYKDVEESKATVEGLSDEIEAIGTDISRKSVVLMKNHENTLPLADVSKKVYIASYTSSGADDETVEKWTGAFEAAGYTIVSKADEADIAFLDVVPGGVSNSNTFMNVIDLVDGLEVEEVNHPENTEKTGEMAEATTLIDVKKIADTAEKVHANGGSVIASIDISSPWILTNLEPYCDALIGSFSTSVDARMDVLTGAYNPTGKLPVTMVSCNEVIAVNETEVDGNVYEICVSPNDVPGYDKDQYMDAEVLAQSPSGSYAYKDADGNVYAAWFGLSY